MTEDMMRLMLFTQGAPRAVIAKWILRSLRDNLDTVQLAGLKAVVHSYYFFFKICHPLRSGEEV